MILIVPITGKLISYDPESKRGIGSNDNPIRPLDFNKLLPKGCDFKWTAVAYKYEAGVALIEVTFAKKITETEWDNTKDPPEPLAWRKESDTEFYERQAETEKLLLATFNGKAKTIDELYEITKEPRLEMP